MKKKMSQGSWRRREKFRDWVNEHTKQIVCAGRFVTKEELDTMANYHIAIGKAKYLRGKTEESYDNSLMVMPNKKLSTVVNNILGDNH